MKVFMKKFQMGLKTAYCFILELADGASYALHR